MRTNNKKANNKNKRVARIFMLAFALFVSAGLAACSGGGGSAGSGDAGNNAGGASEKVLAEITMEDGAVIALELDRDAAPITVDNFVKLAGSGFYDGLTFHRAVDGFMIQGGAPDGTGGGGSEEAIKGEFSENGWDNPISHERGVISMARTRDPDSATSQFFITNGDARSSLDGKYAAFGRVTAGMDEVDKIAKLETQNEMILEPPVIQSIKIIK